MTVTTDALGLGSTSAQVVGTLRRKADVVGPVVGQPDDLAVAGGGAVRVAQLEPLQAQDAGARAGRRPVRGGGAEASSSMTITSQSRLSWVMVAMPLTSCVRTSTSSARPPTSTVPAAGSGRRRAWPMPWRSPVTSEPMLHALGAAPVASSSKIP